MEINPLKTARGCPCVTVKKKKKKRTRNFNSHPVECICQRTIPNIPTNPKSVQLQKVTTTTTTATLSLVVWRLTDHSEVSLELDWAPRKDITILLHTIYHEQANSLNVFLFLIGVPEQQRQKRLVYILHLTSTPPSLIPAVPKTPSVCYFCDLFEIALASELINISRTKTNNFTPNRTTARYGYEMGTTPS